MLSQLRQTRRHQRVARIGTTQRRVRFTFGVQLFDGVDHAAHACIIAQQSRIGERPIALHQRGLTDAHQLLLQIVRRTVTRERDRRDDARVGGRGRKPRRCCVGPRGNGRGRDGCFEPGQCTACREEVDVQQQGIALGRKRGDLRREGAIDPLRHEPEEQQRRDHDHCANGGHQQAVSGGVSRAGGEPARTLTGSPPSWRGRRQRGLTGEGRSRSGHSGKHRHENSGNERGGWRCSPAPAVSCRTETVRIT